MGYYIDLEKISVDEYQEKLKSAYLPPSRRILKERLDERFGYFKHIGIKNVKELLLHLKKKDIFSELSIKDCFTGNYLTILLRELNSILPRPNKIADFPGISKNIAETLVGIGIKTTVKLYDRVLTKSARQALAAETGISENSILELTKLTDLSRVKWVGVMFARMLYDLGVDTARKVSESDPEDLHRRVNRLNKEKNIYRGQIGLNDIQILIHAAKEIPFEIEF